MRDDHDISLADREMELALGSLVPVGPRITATSILEESLRRAETARRAARAQTWIWRVAAMGLAASLALVVWLRSPSPAGERVVVKVVEVERNRTTVTSGSDNTSQPVPGSCAYLVLRQQVLMHGLGALPEPPANSSRSAPLPGEERQLEDRNGERSGV